MLSWCETVLLAVDAAVNFGQTQPCAVSFRVAVVMARGGNVQLVHLQPLCEYAAAVCSFFYVAPDILRLFVALSARFAAPLTK